MTPQPGLEMLDFDCRGPGGSDRSVRQRFVDLCAARLRRVAIVQPVKPLPNGHFLVVYSPNSTTIQSTLPPGTPIVAREIDLTGATIREITMDTLNSRLAAAGFNYTGEFFPTMWAFCPNGHWILLVNSTRQETENGVAVSVLGDALIDLDTNLNPVWLWNTFDHLDVNRDPVSTTDWTHANAVRDLPQPMAILFCRCAIRIGLLRSITTMEQARAIFSGIWGSKATLFLVGGTDPTDWFSGQQGPLFTTPTTAGTFGLAVFDNGDFRNYPAGVTCADTGAPTCPAQHGAGAHH